MKKEELIALGIAEDVADKIFAIHGKDIAKLQTAADTAKTESEGLKTQLTEAGATIEGFKKMDVDGIKAAADEWKQKAADAQAEATKQIAALKYDHALEGALSAAQVKNAKAVKALLDANALKFNDADGSIVGLDDQLKKVKETDSYLFTDTTPVPVIVKGGQPHSVIGDNVFDAARKAAGLPAAK